MSYQAIVALVEDVRKHPNADRLNIATVLGYSVIVGLDTNSGDKVLLFPDDGQLSEEFAKANDLIARVDAEGNKAGGYFDQNRRVKAQKLRGVKSEAFVIGMQSLDFALVGQFAGQVPELPVGTRLDSLNGVPICNKFVTEATRKAGNLKGNLPKQSAELKAKFPEHKETDQFRFANDVDLCGLVTVTAKLHGTSQRSACLLVSTPQPRTWLQKLFGRKEQTINEWKHIYGTRRVIKGEPKPNYNDYRTQCHNKVKPAMRKGEVWYYEIVGFEDTGRPIMGQVSTKQLGKEFVKQFGDTITYKYGCKPGECEVYVYRITYQNEDGHFYELPWADVKQRCKEYGLNHAPQIWQCTYDWFDDADQIGPTMKRSIGILLEEYEKNIADPLDASHIKEGVCIRVDSLNTGRSKIWKHKTFEFKVLEGIIKDSGVVDVEEAESIIQEEAA